MTKKPQEPTAPERLAYRIGVAGLPEPTLEYRFDPVRRWRIDLAYPRYKLAIEVDGGIFIGGKHSRGAGIEKDNEKRNALATQGWRLLTYTPRQVDDGTALKQIELVLLEAIDDERYG